MWVFLDRNVPMQQKWELFPFWIEKKRRKKDTFFGGVLVPTFVGTIKWSGAKRSNFWRRRQKPRMRGKSTQRDGQTYGWRLTPAVEDAHRWCSYCQVAKRFRRRLFVYSVREKERPCAHKLIIPCATFQYRDTSHLNFLLCKEQRTISCSYLIRKGNQFWSAGKPLTTVTIGAVP